MKYLLIILASSFFSCKLYILFLPSNSKNVGVSNWFPTCPQFKRCFFWTALLGALFNKYMTMFKAYTHNDSYKDELLYMLLTIFIKVQLHLSNTPVVYLTLCIKHKYHVFSRNLANGPGCCPLSSYFP